MKHLIIISRRVVAIAFIIAAATPTIVTPGLIFPFVTGKSLFLELVVAAVFPFWITLLLLDPASRPARHPLAMAIVAQTTVAVLAGVFGVDPLQSFWGRDERMLGVFTLLHLLALLGMALSVFRTTRAWKNLLLVVVGIAWVNILWGIGEHFFPGFWSEQRGGSTRVVGLLGNPIFYAGYLLGIVFLAAALLPEVRSRWAAVALWATIIAGSADVFFSGTRGAVLGLFAGLAAVLIVSALVSRRRSVRVGAMVGTAGIILLLTVLALFRDSAFVQSVPEFRRLGSAFSFTDTTAVQRLRLWRVSLEGIIARPVLGWGRENFDYLFDQHFDPALLRYTLRETFADRPHNAFLEAATDGGVLGFIAFVMVQVFFVATVLRLRRKGEHHTTIAASIGFLAAVDIQLLFAFDTVSTMLTTILFSGWLIFKTGPEGRFSERDLIKRHAGVPALLAGIVSITSIVVGVVRPAMAFFALEQAHTYESTSSPELWLDNLRRTADNREPYQNGLRLRIGNAIFSAVGDGNVAEEYVPTAVEFGIQTLQKAAHERPQDYGTRFTLGNLFLLSAIRGRSERFAEADAEFLRAAELSPRRQSTYIQLGNLKLVAGDPAPAIGYYRKAMELDPEVGEPHWHLGRGLIRAGENEQAALEFDRAWELGFRPKLKTEIREAASLYVEIGNYEMVVALYERAVSVIPGDAQLFAELAVAYAAVGRNDDARNAVRAAVELDASFAAEAEEFLEMLESGALLITPQ